MQQEFCVRCKDRCASKPGGASGLVWEPGTLQGDRSTAPVPEAPRAEQGKGAVRHPQ